MENIYPGAIKGEVLILFCRKVLMLWDYCICINVWKLLNYGALYSKIPIYKRSMLPALINNQKYSLCYNKIPCFLVGKKKEQTSLFSQYGGC